MIDIVIVYMDILCIVYDVVISFIMYFMYVFFCKMNFIFLLVKFFRLLFFKYYFE